MLSTTWFRSPEEAPLRHGSDLIGLARWLLKGRRTKRLMRTAYALRSAWKLKHSLHDGRSTRDYWQAGKSVAGIHAIEPAAAIVRRFAAAARG